MCAHAHLEVRTAWRSWFSPSTTRVLGLVLGSQLLSHMANPASLLSFLFCSLFSVLLSFCDIKECLLIWKEKWPEVKLCCRAAWEGWLEVPYITSISHFSELTLCAPMFCLHKCMSVNICVPHTCSVHRVPKRASNPLELELQCGCWESISNALQEQQVLSATEPPLQLLGPYLKVWVFSNQLSFTVFRSLAFVHNIACVGKVNVLFWFCWVCQY